VLRTRAVSGGRSPLRPASDALSLVANYVNFLYNANIVLLVKLYYSRSGALSQGVPLVGKTLMNTQEEETS
jgi:hypothetical protein